MRSVLMQVLTAAMCGAAILAFGVAKAGDDLLSTPAGYIVIDPDASIPSGLSVSGYTVLSDSQVLLRAGASRLYIAELNGTCGRGAAHDWTIGIDTRGTSRIDRFAQMIIDGRRCAIRSLAQVERAPEAEG